MLSCKNWSVANLKVILLNEMKTSAIFYFASAAGDIIFRIIQVISSLWFRILYRKPGEKMPPITNPLLLCSATELARKIRLQEVTSLKVVKAFINRIREVNPMLNFMIDERFDEAVEEAAEIDKKIASGVFTIEEMAKKLPFLGVPFTFKQCISLKGFRHTVGLHCRRYTRSIEDADVLLYLKEAGAIPLASTNVSELCMWWESFNSVHGRTNNPYNTNHTAGGSSGGEACALASAASPLGIGSDVGGSLRIPAFFNGIFSHKPSNGVGSIKGHFPYPRHSHLSSYIVIGPMCRYATDLLPLCKVILKNHEEELKFNEKVDIKRLNYYYMDDDSGSILVSPVDPELKLATRKVVNYFNKKFGITVKRVNLTRLRYSIMMWFSMLRPKDKGMIATELSDLNVYLEVLKFIFGSSRHTFPLLAAGIFEDVASRIGDCEFFTFFEKQCQQLKKEFEDLLGSDGIFIYPTLPTSAPHHIEPITKPFDLAYCGVFNCLGFPVTQCPVGFDSKGIPIGVQIVAAEKQDRLTMAVAEELERAFSVWNSPEKQI